MTSYVEEIESIVSEVSTLLGKPIAKDSYNIIDRGVPRTPQSIPAGKMGIYIFILGDVFLKIGKAGPSSNARFLSQHYSLVSEKSTLAASILADSSMKHLNLDEDQIGAWIKVEYDATFVIV